MKTAVLVCTHHSGHLNPMVSLIPVFSKGGYAVHFFTAESRKAKMEKAGAVFHCDGPAYDGDLSKATVDVIVNKFKCEPTYMALSGHLFEEVLPTTVAYLEGRFVDRVNALKPDVIVADVSALWGVLAARLLKIPLITSCSCALMDTLDFCLYLRDLDFLKKSAEWLREKYGVEYDPRDSYCNESDFCITWSVKQFQFAEKKNASNVRYFGAAMPADMDACFEEGGEADRQKSDSLMQWIEQARKSKKKVIYCCLGTVVGQEGWTLGGKEGDMVADFYKNVFQCLGNRDGYCCIVSIGQNRKLEDMNGIPDNFYVRQSIPQLLVLSKVDVFISHCGNNSVHEAFFMGCPLLCVPVFGDQHPNAVQITKQNLGVQIPSPFAPEVSPNLDHVTGDILLHKLDQVLVARSSEILKGCEEIKTLMRKQHVYFHGKAMSDMEAYMEAERKALAAQ
jgi:MGT family glycosyltransferase